MDNTSPVTPAEFSTLMAPLAPFEAAPILAIAVSGGADSMALLLLAQEWVEARGGKVVALTVDHGLRSESAAEAAQVATWCAARGIKHHTLRWPHSSGTRHPTSVTQSIAREARYRLLTDWCRAHDVLHLLTAHHAGDQAETLFLRLARGSGLDGLACMAPLSLRYGVRLLRPLLAVDKARLRATLMQHGQPWLEDPSNQSPRYTRNVIRRQLADAGISTDMAPLIERLGKIRNALENNVVSYLTNSVSLYPDGYGLIDGRHFCDLPQEYGLKALAALLVTLGGEAHPPRREKLKRLHADLMSGLTRRRSLGGCLFVPRPQQRLLVCREPAALPAPQPLPANQTVLWDRRFEVIWSGDGPDALTLRALGRDGLALLAAERSLPHWLQKPVLSALPSLWHLEKLVAAPHIGYHNPDYPLTCTARFRPAKALAGAAFFSMNSQGKPQEHALRHEMKGFA